MKDAKSSIIIYKKILYIEVKLKCIGNVNNRDVPVTVIQNISCFGSLRLTLEKHSSLNL